MSRKLLFLLALLVIAGGLAYWLSVADFNWPIFFSSLSDMKLSWLALSIAFSLLTYFIRAIRWQALLAPMKLIPIPSLFWTTIVGFAAIYVLGRAAEIARPLWLYRKEQVPLSASIATVIVERFLDSLMLIAVFAAALVAADVPPESAEVLSKLKSAGWFIAGTAAVAMVMLFMLRAHSEWIAGQIRYIRFPGIAALVEDFARGLALLGNARRLVVVIVDSAVLWLVMAMQSWFMFFGMDLNFSFGAATIVMVALAIGSLAQIPAIGGGFQVAWIFCMTTFFRIPAEQAAATSLIAFVASYSPTVIVGGVYLVAQGISLREFKAIVRGQRSEAL